MKAIVVTDQAGGGPGDEAGGAPEPQAAINESLFNSCVGIHRDELTCLDLDRSRRRDRTPSIPDTNWPEWYRSRLWHDGLSIGQRGCASRTGIADGRGGMYAVRHATSHAGGRRRLHRGRPS